MLIQNYGLHWKRDRVSWGRPGVLGDLKGRLSSRVNSPIIDFREQAGIYILQDKFSPIYIGQSGSGDQRLFIRLRNHTRYHLAERWDRFSWFGIIPVKKKGKEHLLDSEYNAKNIVTKIEDILNHIEGVLISITEPPLNKQGAKFGNASQYIQIGKDFNLAQIQGNEDDDYEEE